LRYLRIWLEYVRYPLNDYNISTDVMPIHAIIYTRDFLTLYIPAIYARPTVPGPAWTPMAGLTLVKKVSTGFSFAVAIPAGNGFGLGVGVERGQPERGPPFDLVTDERYQAVHGFALGAYFFNRFYAAVPKFQYRF